MFTNNPVKLPCYSHFMLKKHNLVKTMEQNK